MRCCWFNKNKGN